MLDRVMYRSVSTIESMLPFLLSHFVGRVFCCKLLAAFRYVLESGGLSAFTFVC